jgi:predicted transcriptional regulator
MESRVKIVESEKIGDVIQALNSPVRRKIMELLLNKPAGVSTIANALGIPQSTATVNVQILQKAGLLSHDQGSKRLLATSIEEVVIPLRTAPENPESDIIEIEMPIGLYSSFEVRAPCGLVSESKPIGFFDTPASFLDPHRASAQMIWLSNGFLEYPFFATIPPGKKVKALTVTAEICSEYPEYKLDWPSDITVWVSGVEIGTWTSPGDMGGTRGRLTPEWWPTRSTQFGFKKSWTITGDGCYIDGVRVSNDPVSAIDLSKSATVRIGIKEQAENQGGFCLFGRKFGNYEHDLILRIELE